MIKVKHPETNVEWEIRKSTLMKQSGFFRCMFRHDFQARVSSGGMESRS